MSVFRRRRSRYTLFASLIILGLASALFVFAVPHWGGPKTIAPRPSDFQLSTNPSSLAVLQGTAANTTVSIRSLNDFAGSISLSASVSPSGLVTTLSSGTAIISRGGTTTSRVTISTLQATPIGSYSVTLTGTNGSVTHSTVVGVLVTTPEIRITYSSSYNSTIGGVISPPPGSIFLLVHLTVENSGYRNFSANPIRDMYVTVGGNRYNVSAACFVLISCFQPTTLSNAQSGSGQVVFEVPQASADFNPGWRLALGEQIRFDWVRIS